MTSEELNRGIRAICDREDLEIGGGKCIPYIGWHWRDVDFTEPSYRFGVIPGGFQGFMENNKWGYSYTRLISGQEWETIKQLLITAVTNPTKETTKAVWDYIQEIE